MAARKCTSEVKRKGVGSPVFSLCRLQSAVGVSSFVWGFWVLALPLSRSPLCLLADRKPVALTIHLQDMDMMGEPVEQGASEPFRAEDGRPFIERQIAGNHRCTTFIALAEYLEEQFGADGCEWHIAQFIDDQQLDGVEVLLQRAQPAFVARFHELMDESCRGR